MTRKLRVIMFPVAKAAVFFGSVVCTQASVNVMCCNKTTGPFLLHYQVIPCWFTMMRDGNLFAVPSSIVDACWWPLIQSATVTRNWNPLLMVAFSQACPFAFAVCVPERNHESMFRTRSLHLSFYVVVLIHTMH